MNSAISYSQFLSSLSCLRNIWKEPIGDPRSGLLITSKFDENVSHIGDLLNIDCRTSVRMIAETENHCSRHH